MDRSRVPSARRGARAVTHGACTGRNGARHTSPRSSSDFLAACGASLDGSRGRFGRAEGPRRGTKPREGRDAARSATVVVVIRTRRRSNAPKSTLRTGGIPRCSPATVGAGGSGRCDSQRQGGNGHGDVVRLPARIPSRGVKRAARTASPPPTAIGSPMSGSGSG